MCISVMSVFVYFNEKLLDNSDKPREIRIPQYIELLYIFWISITNKLCSESSERLTAQRTQHPAMEKVCLIIQYIKWPYLKKYA